MDAKHIAKLLAQLEKARREENYLRMDLLVQHLYGGIGTSEEWETRSRISYELHMAAYQQAMNLLKESEKLAERSAEEARKAEDLIGILFAKMNIGGLIYPAMGKFEKSVALSKEVLHNANSLIDKATDDKTRSRALRVATNAFAHLCKRMKEFRWPE